ncbi:MAG TPA: hypothetical protein VNJ03_01465 [Vicinamibacterales bacterium]|nr:hypothetical protein [Vicinamibacterales bacterium]
MTIDAGLAKVAAKIDEMLAQRWDAAALSMISAGANPNDRGDLGAGPPPGGLAPGLVWRRLTFDEVLQRQKDADLAWRAETLARVRAELTDWADGRRAPVVIIGP